MHKMKKVSLAVEKRDYVVLLHGLSRDRRIMEKLERYLDSLGYIPYNDSYESLKYPIEELAKQIWENIQKICPDPKKKIHFVGHSLGCLITRAIIAYNSIPNLGRVVMIAPPSQGLQLVDYLSRFEFYPKKFGPAGMQLGTNGFAKELPQKIDYDLGIIAGNRSSLQDLYFACRVVPRPNDGKVSVETTKLDGMKDHIVLKATHPKIPEKPDTLYQVAHFLKYDKFDHS